MQLLLLLMAFLLAPKVEAEGESESCRSRGKPGMLPKKPAGPLLGYGEQKLDPHPSAATSQGNIFSGVADLVTQRSTSENRLISVTLGARNFKKPKKIQQIIPVKTAIIHPDYHPKVNDIMLLQLQRKAKLTATVSPLRLPRMGEEVKPGMECSVAHWGRLDLNTTINTLHEGDSGDPFVCENVAQGIVSFGKKTMGNLCISTLGSPAFCLGQKEQ